MMKKSFFKYLPNLKIPQQMHLIFLVCAIVPILFLGTLAIRQANEQLSEQYESLVNADTARVTSILFDITTSIYTTSDTILSSSDGMYLFASDYPSDAQYESSYRRISAELESLYENNAAIASIHIYTDNPTLPDGTHISSIGNGYADMEWYQKLDGKWASWECLSNTSPINADACQLSLVRRIPIVSKQYTAYLVIGLDRNYMKNRIGSNQHLIFLSVDDTPIFFASDAAWLEQPLPVPENSNASSSYSGPIVIENSKKLANMHTLYAYKTDNLFYIETVNLSAYENVNRLAAMYVFILLIAILFSSAILLIFSTHLSRRITTLKQAMHQARLGDYNIIDTFQGNDELQDTFQDLKATVEIIRENEARYYADQLARQQLINRQQQMEFKMLASQINPHFLYNTLETIRMQALANGNRDVATSIKLLGKSMHYVLENTGTDFTTLAKELDYIKTYLTIQQIRFSSRVNYSIEIQPEVDPEQYHILPLLLQPIVENAIIHGLEDSSCNGYIRISASADSSFLILTVQDNGCGMPPETLHRLTAHMQHADAFNGTSIGLYNIFQRIRLCYGEQGSISIDSSPQHGTTVTLKLPHTATV